MFCDPVNRLPRLVTTLVMAGALLASLALVITGTAVAAPVICQADLDNSSMSR